MGLPAAGTKLVFGIPTGHEKPRPPLRPPWPYVRYDIYLERAVSDKPLIWLGVALGANMSETPPFSREARVEAGFLLRKLQQGEPLALPHSRPMPSIGRRCHELRINDARRTWRIFYRTDADAIVIVEVFEKKTQQTPARVLERVKQRLKYYDET